MCHCIFTHVLIAGYEMYLVLPLMRLAEFVSPTVNSCYDQLACIRSKVLKIVSTCALGCLAGVLCVCVCVCVCVCFPLSGDGTFPRSFLYVAVFWNDFSFSGRPFDLVNKIRYILWVVALLEACEVTNNGRHHGFYQELEMVIFCALHEK